VNLDLDPKRAMPALLALLVPSVALAAAGSTQTTEAPVGADVEKVLAAVDWLVAQRTAPLAGLAAHFGVQLLPSPGSNAYFEMHEGRFAPGSGFARIETRRSPKPPRDEGLTILELAPPPCITAEQVRSRFGSSPNLTANPALHGGPGPDRQRLFLSYPKGWGELRLSFTASGGCLADVVLDWTVDAHRSPASLR
jgi:hypothetical protein